MTNSASAAARSAAFGTATSRARIAAVDDTWVDLVVTSERSDRSALS